MSVARTAYGRSTIVDVWKLAPTRHPDPAFLVKEGKEWREVGWGEAARRVDELAAGFLALGLRKGDRAAILSRTRLEWTLCDYALASIGAVVVPIYNTSSPDECAYICTDSGARVLVCDDAKQLERLADKTAEVPSLEHTVLIDPAPGSAARGAAIQDAPGLPGRPSETTGRADEGESPASDAISLAELEERGRGHLAEQPDAVEEARSQLAESDILTFIYTSGTTGPPKGCVLSHRNWFAMVDSIRRVDDFLVADDVVLLFLPLAHNFARLVQFAAPRVGFTVAFCPDIVQVTRALTEVRPTVLPSVPRLFETVYTNIRGRLDEATGFRRRLADWALRVGKRAAAREESGRRVPPLLALQRRLADRLVFSKITERLGGRLRLAISGGAPLSKEIAEFFAACGVLILEGYGLTETTSGCTMNRPDEYRFGTVGPALPEIEVVTADDGEIMVRGETIFQGYHGREEETAEILIDDGWLLTGDIGTIDEDGFVTITDRKKELIVTAGGKNVSPANLENALKASGLISQVLVVGDRRAHIAALIVPDRQKLGKAGEDEARKAIEQVVKDVNSRLGPAEQIKRFALLPREFSAEEGEVTPTLKLKRRVCEEHFRDEIERLYAGTRTPA